MQINLLVFRRRRPRCPFLSAWARGTAAAAGMRNGVHEMEYGFLSLAGALPPPTAARLHSVARAAVMSDIWLS